MEHDLGAAQLSHRDSSFVGTLWTSRVAKIPVSQRSPVGASNGTAVSPRETTPPFLSAPRTKSTFKDRLFPEVRDSRFAVWRQKFDGQVGQVEA